MIKTVIVPLVIAVVIALFDNVLEAYGIIIDESEANRR